MAADPKTTSENTFRYKESLRVRAFRLYEDGDFDIGAGVQTYLKGTWIVEDSESIQANITDDLFRRLYKPTDSASTTAYNIVIV